MRNAFEGTTSLAPSSKKKKQPTGGASKNSKSKTSDHGSTLASIGGKDPSLDLFHAMGKVLYCKREDTDLVTNCKIKGFIKTSALKTKKKDCVKFHPLNI